MFSEEAIVNMADGTFKQINNIKVNDVILNKFNLPVTVHQVHEYLASTSVGIQLNNGTGVFYCNPNAKVLCHNTNQNGNSIVSFNTISSVHNYNGASSKLKSSSKVFSPGSDVSITTYDDPTPPHIKDLYCIHTSDSSQTFFINKIITSCEDM